MKATTLHLPLETPHIVVDPLVDFTQGEFVRCYGEPDTEPIRALAEALNVMTNAWKLQARLILCKSSYQYNQFGVRNLERLCTTEEGRRSVIPEDRFDRIVSKYDNSLLSADIDFDELLGDTEFFGIAGLTTTSCVIRTIQDCRRSMRDRTIIVPADAVCTRASRRRDGDAILAELSDPNDLQVIVVESWRSILHVHPNLTSQSWSIHS